MTLLSRQEPVWSVRRAERAARRRLRIGGAMLRAWLAGVSKTAPVGTLLSLALAALVGLLALRAVAPADAPARTRPGLATAREAPPDDATANRAVAPSDDRRFDVYIVASDSGAVELERRLASVDAVDSGPARGTTAHAIVVVASLDREAGIVRAVFDTAALALPGMPTFRINDVRDANGP